MSSIYKRALDMSKGIVSNRQIDSIKSAYEYVTSKYGKGAIISGGSMVDCLYGLEFYDIDVFISSKDCIVDFNKKNAPINGIVDVLNDKFMGLDIDIVIVNGNAKDQIKRFDLNIKKIYFDGKFNFTKAALRDIRKNKLTFGLLTRQVCYLRYIKSIQKYNLDVDYKYMYLSWLATQSPDGTIKVSNKYKDKVSSIPCRKLSRKEELLYNLIVDYMKYINEKRTISCLILKLIVKKSMINVNELSNMLSIIKYY